ncbi:nuclear transport factor 2 family protein [Nostoc sp.]|uniref:nuclear transport factor 2 family protein n=1 Tax=Nostoc sp. TaxID=1180 RepID=UPI002FF7D094
MHQLINLSTLTAKKELIVTLFCAVDSYDWNLLLKCFDKNIIYERPGYEPLIGIDQLLHFYKFERIIASGKHQLEHIVIEKNHGVCWGQFMGLHKNGSPINERFADVFSFEKGKFKTRRTHFFRPAV